VIENPAQPNENWNAEELEIERSSAPYRAYNISDNEPIVLKWSLSGQ